MCISVLEHTDNYRDILSEFARVLVPGGQLVLTFDVSLDGQADISPVEAEDLLAAARDIFSAGDTFDLNAALGSPDLLTTENVRRTQPKLLPWRRPTFRQAVAMLRRRRWPQRRFVKLACCGAELRKI